MNIKEANKFIEYKDYYIIMVQYKKEWVQSYIDKDDYEKVNKLHWRTSHKKNKIYLVTGSAHKKNLIYLHNLLMSYTPIPNYEIDHIDGNSLNNRKNNLRLVTRQENIENVKVRIDNKIGIRGICKIGKKYQVDFTYRKHRFYFPYWNTIEEAVYCRKYAEEYFGLEIIKHNPLAQQYLTLTENKQQEIYNIILEILRK